MNTKTIELYAGTRSFSLVAKQLGFETFTTDYEEIDGQDLVADIRTLTPKDFPYKPDILWASPPCEGFSVASIGANWGGGAPLHSQEHHRMSVPGSSESRQTFGLYLGAAMVVYRKSTWRVEESTAFKRFTIHAHNLVLQIWRYASETYKYLDKCAVVYTKRLLQKLPIRQSRQYNQPTLPPRISQKGSKDRHTGFEWLQRSIQDPFRIV